MVEPLTENEIELLLDCTKQFQRRHRDFEHQIIECSNRPGLWLACWAVIGPDVFFWRIMWTVYRDQDGTIQRYSWKILHNPTYPLDIIERVHLNQNGQNLLLHLKPNGR